MGFLLHVLRPNDLFVDVGANVGSYTVLASSVCRARTIAFEPDPETVTALKDNVRVNSMEDRVEVLQVAAGANQGTAFFTKGLDTTNRILEESEWMLSTQVVKVTTLDTVLLSQDPILMKLDVEGHESAAIRGSFATLEKPSLLALLVETVDPAVNEALRRAGFVKATYDPFSRSLEAGRCSNTGNVLFVRDLERCAAIVKSAPQRTVLSSTL
jgi:FkbM family methyltransferase